VTDPNELDGMTLEELELQALAKEAAKTPPEVIPDAADLPDDVRDGVASEVA